MAISLNNSGREREKSLHKLSNLQISTGQGSSFKVAELAITTLDQSVDILSRFPIPADSKKVAEVGIQLNSRGVALQQMICSANGVEDTFSCPEQAGMFMSCIKGNLISQHGKLSEKVKETARRNALVAQEIQGKLKSGMVD
jgi:hypothetical protein